MSHFELKLMVSLIVFVRQHAEHLAGVQCYMITSKGDRKHTIMPTGQGKFLKGKWDSE